MKNILILLFLCCTTWLVAQKNNSAIQFPHTHSHHGTVCGIGEPMPGLVIPPPTSNRNTSQNTVVFQVNYGEGVPLSAQNAFERTTAILSNLFNSSIPITVNVEASDELEAGTLAGASAGTFLRNFSNAPVRDAWYPIALAEKLEQQEFNANSTQVPFDIEVTYNSRVNWNFVSTNVGSNQFDFVTVMLHELMHGLGFISLDNVNENTNVGGLRLQNFPAAYSTFLENGLGENLLESFDDPSICLLYTSPSPRDQRGSRMPSSA